MFERLDGDATPPLGADQSFAIVDVADAAGDVRTHVRGALDLVTAPHLATHLRHRIESTLFGDDLVVDLGGVDFLGSKGVAALVAAAQEADARGCRLKVVGCRPIVLRILDIAGVRDVLSAVSTG